MEMEIFMKIKATALLILCAMLVLPTVVYAGNHTCGAGTYNKKNNKAAVGTCEACPAGCYCLGNAGNEGNGWSSKTISYCTPGVVVRSGGGDWVDNQDGAGVYSCPSDFPNSPTWSRSSEECYTTYDGKKLNRVAHKCLRGKYLPQGSDTCTDCKTEDMYYCPGGRRLFPSTTKDQGIDTCPAGKIATAEHIACEDAPRALLCSPGTYLAANAEACTTCPPGFACQGGSYSKQSYDQGNKRCNGDEVPNEQKTACVSCAAGKKPNSDNTACFDTDIVVAPGYYLPANTVSQRPCAGTNKYCPGGEFERGTKEQGRFDCPRGSRVNSGLNGCKMTLTKEQMEKGVNGYSSCWTIINSTDYIRCMGISIADANTTNTNSTTNNSYNDIPQSITNTGGTDLAEGTGTSVKLLENSVQITTDRSAKKIIKR